MIMKDFVPHKESLELKTLGFDEYCFGAFTSEGVFKRATSDWNKNSLRMINEATEADLKVLAPLYQQAFRWFREKHFLLNHLTTHLNPYGEDEALEESYGYRIMFNKNGWKCEVWEKLSFFDTLEESELECLRKLIEIVKNDTRN